MKRVERNTEKRSGLPFKYVRSGLTLLPDFGGAASLDYQNDLFIKVPLDVERPGARHLDHVAAPQPFGAVELNVAAAAANPFPGCQWQGLDPPHANAAANPDALRLPETVVRPPRALGFCQPRVLPRFGFRGLGLGG